MDGWVLIWWAGQLVSLLDCCGWSNVDDDVVDDDDDDEDKGDNVD